MAQQIRYGIGFDVKKDGLQQIKKSLKQLQNLTSKDLLNLNKSLDAKDAGKTLMDIKRQAIAVEDALKNAFNTKLNTVNIESFNQSLKVAGTNIEKVYNTFSKAGATGQNTFRSLGSQVLNTNIQLKESHSLLDKMATTLGNTIKWNIASSAVNTLTRSVQQAWGYVKSLDTSLNDIRIVTGKSSEEMGNFAKQANEAAESLGRTTTDYTKAALIYAQQGLDDEEIAKRSQITLKTANVTGQSTDEVSEELTAVWNGYRVNAEEAQVYIDRLAAVAATTASDLEELSTGMSKVAAAANELGVGEDQLAAQLSTIISATRQAPESVGTALKTVYARISDIKAGIDQDGVTLGKYSGDMAALGINVLDAQGKLRDMGSIIEEVGSKWQGMTREQQISLAQTMAGQRQYSNLMALFGNFDKYTSALNTAQNAAGTLQQQQDIYMESTAAHLDQLTAATQNIYNSLFDTNGINEMIDGLTSLVHLVADFVDSLGGGANLFRSLGAIGLTVFSEQIAKGINTTIVNLQIAEENARQFEQQLDTARNWQGIPGLDNLSKTLLEKKGEMLELAKLMTPQQFSGMQKLLQDINGLGNQVAGLQQKVKPFRDTLKQISDQSLENIVGGEGQEKFTKNIQQQIGAFEYEVKAIENVKQGSINLFKEFDKTDPNLFGKIFQNAKNSADEYLVKLTELNASGKLQGHEEQVKRAFQLFKELPQSVSESTQESGQKFNDFFDTVQNIFSGKAGQIRGSFQELNAIFNDPSTIENLQQRKRKFQEWVEAYLNGANRMNKAQMTKNWLDLAGGITQVASAVRQLGNLKNIWSDENLSPSQKVLQTILNLGMSLPMLYNGYTKLSKAVDLISKGFSKQSVEALKNAAASTAEAAAKKNTAEATGEAAVASGVDTVAKEAQTGATLTLATAIDFLEVKFKSLGGSIISALGGPMTVLIGLLAAGVAWTLAMADAAQKARKQRIEEAKTSIEEQNQKQEQIEKNKELYKSLDDLNQQYKEGQITRTDLQGSITDLINQYGEQGKKIETLIGQYHDLNKAIKESRRESAEEGVASAEQEKKDASYVLTQAARDADLSLTDSPYNTKLDNQILDSFKQFGATASTGPNGNNLFNINIEDGQQALDLYDKLVQKKKEIDQNSSISEAERSRSDNYKWLTDKINELRESAQAYRQAVQDLSKYATDLEAINSDNGDFSEDKVKNAQDFQAQREALVNKYKQVLQDKGDTESDPQAMVDAYIQQNYGNTFAKYNQITKFIQQMEKETGQRNEQLVKILQNLNPQQFGQVMEKFALNPQAFSNWQSISVIIKDLFGDIENADLSNVDKIQQMNFDNIEQEAKSKYNDYKDIEKKVRDSGGELEEEDFGKLKTLSPELAGYFEDLGNGTYKLRDDARVFYSEINSLKLDGFDSAIETVQNKIDRLNAVKNSKVTSDEIDSLRDKSSTDITVHRGANGQNDVLEVNKDIAKKKLQILLLTTDINDENYKLLEEYQKQAKANNLNYDIAKDIDKQYNLIAGSTELNNEKIKEQLDLLDQEKEKLEGQKQGLSTDFLPDSEVDPEQLESLTQTIEQLADKDERFAKSLEKDHKTAKEAAHSLLRYNNALEEVDKNYDDWMQALKSDNIVDQNKAMEQLRDTYGDFLNIDGSKLSEEFLADTQNLELMQEAIQGNEDAYNELLFNAFSNSIQLSPEVDRDKFNESLTALQDEWSNMQAYFDSQPIGATIKNDDFLAALNQMITTAGLTTDQVQELLSGMGMSAEFDTNPTTMQDNKEFQDVNSEFVPTSGSGEVKLPTGVDPVSKVMQFATAAAEAVGINYTAGETVKAQDNKTAHAPVLTVKTLKKTSGGDFKLKNTPHKSSSSGGGGKGKKGGGGKKGGSKKGGSSKKNEPDKSQKDLQKKLKDERDIYHDINIQIGKINKNLDRTQKKQDRLYGKQLLQNLNKQTKILEQHKKKLEEKNKLQQQDLKNQQAALSNLGVTFNKYGDIANYMDSLGKKQNEINSLIDKQNALIQKYNKETDKDKKKKISDSIEKVDKTKSTKEEEYKDLQDRIKNYDKLREQMEDIKDQIEEQTQKQIEIQITKFRMKVEIRLEMGQAQRDWNEFRRNVLQHTDILKDSDFSSILKDAQLNQANAQSYFMTQYKNAAGQTVTGPGTIQSLTSQLLDTQKEYLLAKDGKSSIYGDNQKQAMQHLKSDLDELMSQMEDYESLIDEIDQAYLDTIDDIEEFFDKQIEDYEYVNDLINHDMDLLTLLYGEKNYDAMDKYYTKLQSNNLKQIDSLKKQRDFWGQQWKEAAAAGDTKAAEKFKENYKKVIADLNSAVEDAAQTIQDKYTNAIDNIFDKLDKKMTNGKGTDYLNMEWDLMQKNADEYLDTINSAFAIQQTERKYQKAINDTKNIKNQKELKKVMNEQLGILKNKQKLTQYDVDRAQKLLQIEQARIALEDAKSAKTSMQLKRDSQGNYSYEYVADNDAIADAESEYANAVNDLYNFDLDRYKSNLQDMLSAWEDFQEKYKEIQLDVSLTDEERIEQLKLLEEQYGQYINDKTAENLVVRKNLKESAFQDMEQLYSNDVEKYQNMSDDEKDILMNQLVPEWESGIQMMTAKFTDQGGFIPSCEEAFKDIHTATVDYEKELDELEKTAGTDFDSLKSGIDDTADSFSDLIDKNDELIDQMQTELDEIKDLVTAANELSKEYQNVYKQAKKATEAIYNFMQAERDRARQEAEQEAAANGQGAAGGGGQAKFTGDSFAGILKTQGDKKLNELTKSGKVTLRETVDKQISAGGLGGSNYNLIQGLAGNILLTNEWGNGEDRKKKMIEKFGDQLGKELYNRTGLYLQELSTNEERRKTFFDWILREPDWFRIFDYAQFQSNQAMYTQNVNSFVRQGNKGYVYDTGGYTGNWNSKEGRPAVLHEKQLVLNQEDTKNILSSVSIMRSIMTSLTGNLSSRLDHLAMNNLSSSLKEEKTQTVEQQVHIQASFPNINSKREIQEALNDLVNLAAQRAMR